MEKVYDKKDP